MTLRGLFVTGTDTGVGKTVVAAAVIAALRARGERVAAVKPVLTGTDEPSEWRDDELLALVAGREPDEVTRRRFGPAASPHLAAELAGERLEPSELLADVRRAGEGAEVVIVEGVGGLLVPLTPDYLVRDFAHELGLPLVVVARPGLGTINHTLLTLEAARSVGLEVRGVILTPWPEAPSAIELSNRETIELLGRVTVTTLPLVELPHPAASLPLDAWF